MKLRPTLEAEFLRYIDASHFERGTVDLANADGVWFLCPKCYADKGSNRGIHSVICWFVGRVPDELTPGPGRWTPAGSSLDDLTFVPGTPPRAVSVQLSGGCNWHGFVKNGEAA